MAKDGSRRSSIAVSTHASSPHENNDDVLAQDPNSNETGEAAPDVPQPAVSKTDTVKSSAANGTISRAAESQPMTASNSNSSNPSTKDAASSGTGPAIPYGTRSRNRTGNSRPNYAEDKELDAEFEVAPPLKESTGRKATRTVEAMSTTEAGQTQNATRISNGTIQDNAPTIPIHHKDPIPGTSTFSANPTANGGHSKKRKAATQAPLQQPQLQVPPQNTSQAVTRRSSIALYTGNSLEDSNMLSFENCGGRLKNKKLVADDGTVLEVNDHAYLVCEPPGEPYYLGRIMEFLHINNDATQPIDALRLNWYYRAKDIGRKVNDTRQVFASMHSDVSPLTALRGKCQIKHKSEVEKLDELRKSKDSFWYEKLYDRYIHRYYDVIPTSQVINVPAEVKKVLDERWKFIVVEPGRGKELTSAVKSCKRCSKYCASNDSVDCAVCHNTYHMSCVNPPLLKKPSRGFAWACGPCSKAQEKKLEARNTPNVNDPTEDDENIDDDDEAHEAAGDDPDTGRTSPVSSEVDVSFHPGTAEQIHQASLWLFRYLGIHCKVEDALDYDDRIYPRASSRLGPRHQAIVPIWPGRPVEYVKPAEIKRKYVKGGGHKKDTKLHKDTIAALEADKIAREKRPKWVMDEPPGYVHRGEDYEDGDPNSTATLLYKLPEAIEVPGRTVTGFDPEGHPIPAREQMIFDYMGRAAQLARHLGLPDLSTNLLDVALHTLHLNGYDVEQALHVLSQTDKRTFKEPDLSPQELKKFEDGVTKFGSEWHSLKKHVKTVSAANIVRFYYTWKKTERGKHIWGSYSGRKGKKEAKRAEATTGKLQDDVADENDDSAFDNEKARDRKRSFQCKFCTTRESRQWRRAPNTPAGTMISDNPAGGKPVGKDKGNQFMVALCRRCAELWRRYGIQWEDIDEVKKATQASGRAWKRKIDEELLKELAAANEVTNEAVNVTPVAPLSTNGTPAPALANLPVGPEPPRKKQKAAPERDTIEPGVDVAVVPAARKKLVAEKPAGPPPPPEPPKAKILPCAICGQMDPMGDQHLSCKECRMTVHRNCYGVVGENRSPSKWICDMCSNDKNPQVSIQYKCTLCPIEYTEHDFVEPPKVTHKKKTEKERERERIEREANQKAADYFRKKQEEQNRPVNPREPLKRTANNNWVHVTCAVFTPEVKFGNAKALEPSEGIPSIPTARYDETCKVCKKNKGACVSCQCCKTPVHVGCAHQAGYLLGFDISPIKQGRRDQPNIAVNIGQNVGTMTAGIWCKDHVPTKTVHRMHDIADPETGLNALQLYVQNFKQADLTLTGTVRKATLVNQSTKVLNPQATPAQVPNRRSSTTTGTNGNASTGKGSVSNVKTEDSYRDLNSVAKNSTSKICVTCDVDVSPKWWPFPPDAPTQTSEPAADVPMMIDSEQAPIRELPLTNGHAANGSPEDTGGTNVALAAAALHQNPAKLITPTEFQCHQCHWKKIRKEPTPPPPPTSTTREPSRPPLDFSQPPRIATPEPEMGQPPPAPFVWPPPPPSYPPNGPSYNWPRHSPGAQTGPLVNHMNGSHSPRRNSGSMQSHNGQPQMRQPIHGVPHSPRQNGQIPQGPTGFHPPSPHRSMGSPADYMQNGTYPSYASTRPPPQHLTNGGPPPRAPEHPFSHSHAPMHPRHPFGPPHGSPPLLRESHPQSRESMNPPNSNARPNDGRVNGGASASPSLRNLLS
ncbi:putative PHD type zinc finger protein with BAH domain-containing protein [Cadophora gregata]|uniref:putative PHD type zinc finger protein with BAH domain-containing protein n=1 Tax=Cadophora gregata TaxID=51156 RepID=UPI0026DC75D5|nr:putative PHD type zinc finger protein with BAH domain-containing protein [Cadophora gregata]KAK0126255.1 putative PHD type zinc finger protein with BAH domain-containing protein [Cadophora gregata]